MCPVAKGAYHGPAPIPEEGAWVKAYEIKDITGFTHGVGWCAPQQGACKLTLNVKNGVIEEALVETIGCSGMTHSAAMAARSCPARPFWKPEHRPGLRRHQRCYARALPADRLTAAARPLSLRTACPWAPLDDLGKGLRSMSGTMFSTKAKGVVTWSWPGLHQPHGSGRQRRGHRLSVRQPGQDDGGIRPARPPNEAYEKNVGHYGRFEDALSSTSTRVRNKRKEGQLMATFEGYDRRMPKIDACLPTNGIESLEEALQEISSPRASTATRSSAACSPSALITPSGLTPWAAPSLSSGATASEAAAMPSARACRPSPSRLRRRAASRSVWATATWALCCCARTPSASLSWPATSPSLPLRALSASL